MFSPATIPIWSSTPEPRPIKRHQSVKYYVTRVRESLTTRVSKIVCSVFLSLLFFVGVIAFILWLSLRPHRPRFHMHEFSVPGLGQPDGFENVKITFNVTARNSNQQIGIFYDSMDGTVFYRDQKLGSKSLMDPFYQEPKSTTIVYTVLDGASLSVNSDRWMEFTNDRTKGSVAFRLEITLLIRFKVFSWGSKSHRMHATCDVFVGPNGYILPSSKDKRCPAYFL